MSEAFSQQTGSVNEQEFLPDLRSEVVEQAISILKAVAEGDQSYEFTLLPTQFKDVFEVVDLLTDAHLVSKLTTPDSFITYKRGYFHETDVEFALESSKPTDSNPETVYAWGVRRLPTNVPNGSTYVELPSDRYMATQRDINNIDKWPELAAAA